MRKDHLILMTLCRITVPVNPSIAVQTDQLPHGEGTGPAAFLASGLRCGG